MKKIIAFFLSFFLFLPAGIHAQTTDAQVLSIASLHVVSEKEIDITFSESIVISTLRVMLESQATRDIISVKGYHETKDDKTARIELASDMQTMTSYKLTVSTATAKSGETIVAGVNAIQEFTTPEMFSVENNETTTTLSAPANTTAVTANQEEASTVQQAVEVKPEVQEVQETPSQTQEEVKVDNTQKTLPETGMGMYLVFCILAILFSAMLMKKAKRI